MAPAAGAFVMRVPVRIAIRVPSGTSRLRVLLGSRDVSARFRADGGSLRAALLRRTDGLRYGSNHLLVFAERRGGRPVMDARSFVVARPHAGLVRVRVRPGPVTSVDVRVAAPSLAGVFGQPRELARRLTVIRRERTFRLWLNGRPISRAANTPQRTHWTASLSATHGLRYGVNRLRILVLEPDTGRYAVVSRRFVLARGRHLASAGWDIATRVGGRVTLDGRLSRLARGGRLDYNWRIIAKPRGSRASVRAAGTARPALTPDRPGRYNIALTVRARPQPGQPPGTRARARTR